ncbi:hypothetical protein V8C44DRAFT_331269 [Trichoderma aethiopicum]
MAISLVRDGAQRAISLPKARCFWRLASYSISPKVPACPSPFTLSPCGYVEVLHCLTAITYSVAYPAAISTADAHTC